MEQEIAEVEQLLEQWVKAFNEGNAELIGSMFAEDAQLIAPITPFRIEGKEAIQANISNRIQASPIRQINIYQLSTRIYNGTTAVVTYYFGLTATDNKGEVVNLNGRGSSTSVKQGERWLIISQHGSALPAST